MASSASINGQAATVAGNLRRIMARDGLTFEQVVAATELDERTLRSLARGVSHPHARQLMQRAGMRMANAASEAAKRSLVELGGGHYLLKGQPITGHYSTQIPGHSRGVPIDNRCRGQEIFSPILDHTGHYAVLYVQ